VTKKEEKSLILAGKVMNEKKWERKKNGNENDKYYSLFF